MKKIIALVAIVALSFSARAGYVRIVNATGVPITGTFMCWATDIPATGTPYHWGGTIPVTLNTGPTFWPTVEDFYIATTGTTSSWMMYSGFGLTGFQFQPIGSCFGFAVQLSGSWTHSCGMAMGGTFTVTSTYDPIAGNMQVNIF